MVTFLHTSDWQIGATSVQAGARARELRKERLNVVKRIADEAVSRHVDFMIVAGDMFDDHDVDDLLVHEVVEILNSLAPLPVYVIPGNHDFWGHGGVWERRTWKGAGGHIRLLVSEEETEAGSGTALYPCPVRQKRSNIDPTRWITPRQEGDTRIRIGIAHGSLDTVSGSANFPISADRAETSGLDYLALGDWHGMRLLGRTAYPGTPEQTNFGEDGTGNVLIVSLKAGEMPSAEPVRVGGVSWIELKADIREPADVDHLERQLKAGSALRSCLVRIRTRVTGEEGDVLADRLRVLRRLLEEEALFLDWPEEDVRPVAYDAVSIPPGLLAEVDALLGSIQNGSADGLEEGRWNGFTAEDAAEARYLLRDYVRRAPR